MHSDRSKFIKNQSSMYIAERTMKMQKIILAGCLAIAAFNNFAGAGVSSKIDFDSDESEEASDNSSLVTIMNPQRSANAPESILRTPRPFIRHESAFVKTSEPRKRRIYPSHDNPIKQQKIINNIQVIVNNDSIPNENCELNVCNVSVSSKTDKEGNIVTEVHLSIITRAKPNVKIDDVPVINGFQGVSEDNKQSIFHSTNLPHSIYTHLYRNNIPQIQTNFRGYNNPWQERSFRRPQIYWNYRFGNGGNVGFRDHKAWPRDRPVVDDKIEPPLSKTKASDDTE